MLSQTTEERKRIFRRIAEIRFEKIVLEHHISQDLCDIKECLEKCDSDALFDMRNVFLDHVEQTEFLTNEEHLLRKMLEKE